MGREATETICCKPRTKELVKQDKRDGETFDLWLRRKIGDE